MPYFSKRPRSSSASTSTSASATSTGSNSSTPMPTPTIERQGAFLTPSSGGGGGGGGEGSERRPQLNYKATVANLIPTLAQAFEGYSRDESRNVLEESSSEWASSPSSSSEGHTPMPTMPTVEDRPEPVSHHSDSSIDSRMSSNVFGSHSDLAGASSCSSSSSSSPPYSPSSDDEAKLHEMDRRPSMADSEASSTLERLEIEPVSPLSNSDDVFGTTSSAALDLSNQIEYDTLVERTRKLSTKAARREATLPQIFSHNRSRSFSSLEPVLNEPTTQQHIQARQEGGDGDGIAPPDSDKLSTHALGEKDDSAREPRSHAQPVAPDPRPEYQVPPDKPRENDKSVAPVLSVNAPQDHPVQERKKNLPSDLSPLSTTELLAPPLFASHYTSAPLSSSDSTTSLASSFMTASSSSDSNYSSPPSSTTPSIQSQSSKSSPKPVSSSMQHSRSLSSSRPVKQEGSDYVYGVMGPIKAVPGMGFESRLTGEAGKIPKTPDDMQSRCWSDPGAMPDGRSEVEGQGDQEKTWNEASAWNRLLGGPASWGWFSQGSKLKEEAGVECSDDCCSATPDALATPLANPSSMRQRQREDSSVPFPQPSSNSPLPRTGEFLRSEHDPLDRLQRNSMSSDKTGSSVSSQSSRAASTYSGWSNASTSLTSPDRSREHSFASGLPAGHLKSTLTRSLAGQGSSLREDDLESVRSLPCNAGYTSDIVGSGWCKVPPEGDSYSYSGAGPGTRPCSLPNSGRTDRPAGEGTNRGSTCSITSPAVPCRVPFLPKRPDPSDDACTVSETPQEYIILAKLPGFEPSAIQVALKRQGRIHIVADKWDDDSSRGDGDEQTKGIHFEKVIVLGDDAVSGTSGAPPKAAFDGKILEVRVTRRAGLHVNHPLATSQSFGFAAGSDPWIGGR